MSDRPRSRQPIVEDTIVDDTVFDDTVFDDTVFDDTVFDSPDGRTIGVADSGPRDGHVVVWCHGGPGSRREPDWLRADAASMGLRVVGIDRPGYGRSTTRPGRSIPDAVDDVLLVADELGIERFVTVGVSTGGAYALAVAALAPERVIGVVACCSLTDMRYQPARATMSRPHVLDVWDAPDRSSAVAAAIASHGEHGERLLGGGIDDALAPADAEMFRDPTWLAATVTGFDEMFRHGVDGYVDDRGADGAGWIDFDVTDVRCPVIVLHGARDAMADPINARHTAELIPHADLVVTDEDGHFSIERRILTSVGNLVDPSS